MTDADENPQEGTDAPPPGHNQPRQFADYTAEEMRSLKLKAGNLVRDLGNIAERRASLNDEASAIRSQLKEMGFNKNAISQAERLESMRRAENTKPMDGYFTSLRILSAAINVPIDKDGQFGLLFDEPAGEPAPAMTETRLSETTHIPPAPAAGRKKPRQRPKDGDAPIMDASAGPGSGHFMPPALDPAKVFGRPKKPGTINGLSIPLIPDTIAQPRGVKDIDFSEAVIAGRNAYRAGEQRKCPDIFAGDLGGVWEQAWDYEQALSGKGAANAPVVH